MTVIPFSTVAIPSETKFLDPTISFEVYQPEAQGFDFLRQSSQWALLLRHDFGKMCDGSPIPTEECLSALRRRHADKRSATLALHVAELIYLGPAGSSFEAMK